MSLPRQVTPGSTYLLSRRCFQRTFLLRPSVEVNRIFLYCLSVAVEKFHVDLHAFVVLSNHYHLVATDPDGRLPEFMHWLNEYVAKCINALHGRWESVWAPGSYSAVVLDSAEDVMDKMLYVFDNPVSAGLVRNAEQWPGLRSRAEDLGKTLFTALRPNIFFRNGGTAPRRQTLMLSIPPALAGMPQGEVVTVLRRLVREKEREKQGEFARTNRSFLGPGAVKGQSPLSRPEEDEQRRRMNPRVACKDKWRRVEVLRLLQSFRNAYREAWRRFCEGERDVVFPPGTYWMRLKYGVVCSPGP